MQAVSSVGYARQFCLWGGKRVCACACACVTVRACISAPTYTCRDIQVTAHRGRALESEGGREGGEREERGREGERECEFTLRY